MQAIVYFFQGKITYQCTVRYMILTEIVGTQYESKQYSNKFIGKNISV